MDEIDAALDEQNQAIVANAIKDIFKDCQVISISHHSPFHKIANQTASLENKLHSVITLVTRSLSN